MFSIILGNFLAIITLFFPIVPNAWTDESTEFPLVFSYSLRNHEIYSTQISPDNTYLVFTRKFYIPHGHEAGFIPNFFWEKLHANIEANPRYADPEIVLINMVDGSQTFIDYGWDPVFSPDGEKILYSHQKNPLRGQLVLAESQKGNTIREYSLADKTIKTVASPSFGYLSDPKFDSKGNLFFYLSDAVNGEWGGNVGVGTTNASGGVEEICRPQKDFDLYLLTKKFVVYDDKVFAYRWRPLDHDIYLANRYAHELVECRPDAENELVFSWGEKSRWEEDGMAIQVCPSGVEVFYKDRWIAVDTATFNHPPDIESSLSYTWPAGLSNPNCTLRVVPVRNQIMVLTHDSVEKACSKEKGGPIASVSWSEDGTLLMLVRTNWGKWDEKYKHDSIEVINMAPVLPASSQP